MNAQRLGYTRVSTVDQSTARQLAGMQIDRMFEDKASGKDRNRPALTALLAHARPGDTVLCHSFDRFSRSVEDLRALVSDLTERGVRVEFVKEGLIFSGERSHISELMLGLLGSIAQFERSMLLERQKEGIAIAKAQGKYRGGTPKLSEVQAKELVRLAAEGVPKAKLAKRFKVTRETIYQYLRKAA